jgi:uncharacterized tellurite resistance protein B-like protein
MMRTDAMRQPANPLEYEKILFRYSSALQRGDFEAVAAVLELAQADPELERLLLQLNQAYVSPSAAPLEPEAGAVPAPQRWLSSLARIFKIASAGQTRPSAPIRPWAVLACGALLFLLVAIGVFNIYAGLSGVPQTRGLRGLIVPTVYSSPLTRAATAIPAPTQAPAPTVAPAATQAPAPTSQPYPVPQAAIPSGTDHLIVRDGNLTLVVTDTRKTRDAIQKLVASLSTEGAFVVSSSEMNSGDATQPVIQMSLRVPAARFEATMDALAAMAQRVDARNESAQDVTAQYVDLQAQLEQLQAARQRLLEIMKSAANANDLLQAESLLTQREAEIASIQGRMKYLAQTAQLSGIQLTLNPSVLSQPIQPSGWNPAETARLALGSLVGRLQAFVDWLITFSIATLPWLLAAGLLIFAVFRLVVRRTPG